jgi:CheY-like chemotaxis protein
MPPEVVARVFEPSTPPRGLAREQGLGLSMVYGFAKQSGGHVEVYSEPGIGTTISLYLPVAEGQEASERAAMADAVPLASAETILLVEDEPAFRHFLATTLEKLGYKVVSCADGPSALAKVDGGLAPDLLLTDLILPGGLNGREIAEQVHERRPSVPVLFMSGYPDTVLSERGTQSRSVRLLRKPFRKVQLAQAIQSALDVPRRQRLALAEFA